MAKKLNCYQAYWSLYLACFDFTLVYCPGHSIEKPDVLFQRLDHSTGTSDNEDVTLLHSEMFTIWALEGIKLEGAERNMLSDICKDNHNGNQEKPVAWAACKLQQSSSQIVYSIEQSNVNGLLCFQDKIYVFQNLDLHRYIVLLYYDTKIARHSSWWKTLELISWNYQQPQISWYIGQYVSTCDLCLRTKPMQHPPVGKLYPLPVQEIQWNTLSIDFIVELSKLSRHDTVIMVVDLVSKRVHFIPMHMTVTTEEVARLFLYYVQKLHGLSR